MANAIKTETLLFVGAAEGDGLSLGAILRGSDWQLHKVRNCQEALKFLDQNCLSVVLSEAELPDGNWKELLNSMARLSASPSLIVSSRLADDRLWAEVLNLGGFDVLMTPFETEEVLRVTDSARQNWERRNAARAAARGQADHSSNLDDHDGPANFTESQVRRTPICSAHIG